MGKVDAVTFEEEEKEEHLQLQRREVTESSQTGSTEAGSTPVAWHRLSVSCRLHKII